MTQRGTWYCTAILGMQLSARGTENAMALSGSILTES